jgi:hypothetical protein
VRTTVNISTELLDAAKRRARETGRALGAVIDDALRRELSTTAGPGERRPIRTFDGRTGAQPGANLTSNRELYELLDEGLPLDKLR